MSFTQAQKDIVSSTVTSLTQEITLKNAYIVNYNALIAASHLDIESFLVDITNTKAQIVALEAKKAAAESLLLLMNV